MNGRTDIAKKAGTFGILNLGQLATKRPQLVDENSERYRHAKTVMNTARQLHQQATGTNLRVIEPSSHIEVEELLTLAKML